MQQIRLKDLKNNVVVEVPFDDVGPMVATGDYELPIGKSLPILDKQGNLGEVRSEDYISALQAGFTPAKSVDIQKAVDMEVYGDSPLQTAAERALSAATFGATDFVARQLAPVYADEMAKREELNPVSAVIGEVAGTVGPLVLSGGTSLVGKAAAKSGPALADAAGQAVAKQASKIASKVLPTNKLAQKVIQDVIPRAAGLGVEGALYGAGNYISDVNLGTAEASAENLMADVGLSGLLGAGLGGALGAGKILLEPVAAKLVGMADVDKLAKDFVGAKTVKQQQRIFGGDISEKEIADLLVNDAKIGIKVTDSADNVLEKMVNFKENVGQTIDGTLGLLRESGEKVLPRIDEIVKSLDNKANELKKKYLTESGAVVSGREAFVKNIDDAVASFKASVASQNPASKISIDDLQRTRRSWDNLAKYDKLNPANPTPIIYRDLRQVFREAIDTVAKKAESVNPGVSQTLKQANRDYRLVSTIEDTMTAKLQKANDTLNLKELVGSAAISIVTGQPLLAGAVLGAAKLAKTQYAQNAQLIYAVQRAQQKVDSNINSALRNFFIGGGKALKASTLKLSTDAKEYSAFADKVEQYANNPDQYLETVNKRNIAISQQMPQLTAAAEAKGLLGMQFLASKLPRPSTAPGLLERKYIPTTQQRAKFMRYAETVENPMKALEHFEKGTLSRENVEALKVVYPEIYKKLVASTSNFLAKHGQKLSYNKKVQLGLLLDMPADSTMTPSFILSMQKNYMVPEQQETSVTGLGNVEKSGRMNYKQDT